ncbi:aminomethyl-transferring glycine dehydrogenase subunit GcvPA [bacterium]|nr:aminomethyl-transferring glycine dehydrogenase subunit GcvPA [bacterium]
MRYTPHTEADVKRMLESLGLNSLDELFRSIPAEVQARCRLSLPEPLTEMEVTALVEEVAAANCDPFATLSFLGGGAWDHYIPAATWQLLSRSELYTCYTPYQAEVSQGTLQAIYEYQSLVCRLTGMDIANASGYDGGSVTADAALMAAAINDERSVVLVSDTVNPAYRQVVETYNSGGRCTVRRVPSKNGATDPEALAAALDEDTVCVIVQSPNFLGALEDTAALCALAKEKGALSVVVCDPVALALTTSPGEAGADIAVGEGQPLGVPLSFGGPYLGFFATREGYKRQLPGRLVGMTEDVNGKPGYVLTLQTREQHIKRERATSNICTNQALLALAATIHLTLLGREGLTEAANLSLQKAHYLAERIAALPGWSLAYPEQPFFREFVLRPPKPPREVIEKALARGFLAGIDLGRLDSQWEGLLLTAVTEKRTRKQMDSLVETLASL